VSTHTITTSGDVMSTTDDSAVERGRLLLNTALVVVLVALATILVVRYAPQPGTRSTHVPRSAALESLTGVRVTRIAVVGDGGLVTVFYLVLDPEKATRFQADRDHPPTLRSEARDESTHRTSIMRTGHAMRAGQTYYLVYENTGGALRSGETVTLSYGGASLHHVPVL
jgi:hypothetical protein